MFLIDSHCHLHELNYETLHKNVDDVITKAAICDVKFILAVSTTLSSFKMMVDMLGNLPCVAWSCGIHPLNQEEEWDFTNLRQLASDQRVIAIGETGLDYYYQHQQKTKIRQQAAFRKHIQVGRELNKPVIVHMRAARDDVLAILSEEQVEVCGGVLHCFTEDCETAAKLLDIGLYISFSGIITFRYTETLRKVVRYIPLDRMLLETDSPYLTPVPHRGKENQPAFIRDIAEYIAALKGVSIETLAHATTQNFSSLFNISMSCLTTENNGKLFYSS